MWHKLQNDLFSYYSKQKVNGVMGVNGIMRTCHTRKFTQQNIKALRKHTYSDIEKISPPKTENVQIKKTLIFFIFLLKTQIVGTR